MTAIAASTGTMRSRVDGTLVMTIEFQPSEAQDAFRLFAAPGTQVAIAALKAGTYLDQPKEPEKPKGGELARLAGIWCNDRRFWDWAWREHDCPISNEAEAAEWVRGFCEVNSRAELDSKPEARLIFHKFIREPFSEYLKTH